MGIHHSQKEIIIMYHFFTETTGFTETEVTITGSDVNHIKNVLRMKPGEQVLISDGKGENALCELSFITGEEVRARIITREVCDTELPVEVTLYQGLPKGDKMELIIQKCVELGVTRIVPVEMSRCVVKLDAKKEDAKRKRWQTIAESAAKQSKRMIVPTMEPMMKYKDAIAKAEEATLSIVPYEAAETLDGSGGMARTRELIGSLKMGDTCAVFIGPEGGFADEEIAYAMDHGVRPVTLGKRILRTETAGMFVLSAIGFALEE